MKHPTKKPRRVSPEALLHSLHKTRCANLLALVGDGKRFATQGDLAMALGLSGASYLTQLVGPNPRRRFTEAAARRFEHRLRLETGALDVEP